MSVYYKEKPEYLRESIQSMLDQTVPTNDFVIVCDGPLTQDLDAVLDCFYKCNPELFQIVRLPENVGIGAAANIGLKYCKNDLIAKMDSDDISLPTRCEKELKCLENDPEVAIVGSHIMEFIESKTQVVSWRKVPVDHCEILKYAKRRSPFNNQTVIYRKGAVEAVNGYSQLSRCEDYDLYARILHAGYRTKNLDEALVYYRLDPAVYERRKNVSNLKGFIQVRWKLYRSGFLNIIDFLLPCIAQIILSAFPISVTKFVYTKLLRRQT